MTGRNGMMVPGHLRGRDASRRPCYSRTAMQQLEKGATRAPRMSHLRTLADVLGVSMDDWAGRQDTPVPKRPRPRKATSVG
jgi:hypothetical protein